MAVNSEKNYYINPKALSFTPNYQGYRNIVYVSIVSNAYIKAYHNDIDGLGYGMDAEYQTWRLSGTTTALGTASAYFIYARLSRSKQTADIIFSVRDYTVEGGYSYIDSEGNAQTVEKSDKYFFIKIGSLTETYIAGEDATVNRVLTYVSGELGTDKQINEKSDSVFEQMFEFVSSTVGEVINVKKPFHSIKVAFESVFNGLATFVKGFVLGEKEITAIATSEDSYSEEKRDSTLPTIGYVQKELDALDDHFLIKDDADAEQSVAGPVTFEQNVTVQGDQSVGGNQTVSGNQTIGGTQEVRGVQTLHQGFKTPDFNDAAGQITGAQLTASGILTVSGLKAMSFEVFELIYNVIRARGGKEVISNAATIESCQYKLTDGTLITPDEFYAQGSSYTLESIESVYLTIKKDEQNKGLIPFRNSDILYGYVNSIGTSGQYAVGGECIMSIIQSDDTIGADGSMTIEAKLFEVNTTIQPSEEGYYNYVSSNMAPTNGMAVAQRGNTRGMEGRTTSFFIDSETSNIIILQNVTTPRLSTGNYGVINGLLPSDIYDKVHSKYSFLSKYDPVVYARYGIFENVLQFDFQGNIIRRENNRGAWSAAIAGSANLNERYKSEELTYDVVTYDGQLWKCDMSNVTTAPGQGEGWLLLVAKGADGTSIKVKGTVGSVDELPEGDEVKDGDGYIVGLDLYIWSEQSGEWINAGQFRGENGKTQYLHIAYANKDAQGKIIDFSTTDPTGREYIGTCPDFNVDDPVITEDNDPYTWKYNKGENGKTQYLHIAYANKDAQGKIIDFSTTDPTGREYIGTCSDFNVDDPAITEDDDPYTWKYNKGDSVTGSTIQYAINQSMTNKPNEGEFGDKYPTTINEGDVLWTRTKVNFDNDSIASEWAYSASRQAANGKGINSITTQYSITTNSTQPNITEESLWHDTIAEAGELVPNSYLWTAIITDYEDTTKEDKWSITVQRISADGTSVKAGQAEYQVHDNGVTPPEGVWSTDVPSVGENQYLWTRIPFIDGNETTYAYSVSKSGQSVTIDEIKYATSTTIKQPDDGEFIYTSPPSVGEGEYLWTRTTFGGASKKVIYTYAYQGMDNSAVEFSLQPNVTEIYFDDDGDLSTKSIYIKVRKTTSKGVVFIDDDKVLDKEGFKLQYTYDGILDDRKDLILNPETLLLEDDSELLLEDDSPVELEFTVEDVVKLKEYIEFYLVKEDTDEIWATCTVAVVPKESTLSVELSIKDITVNVNAEAEPWIVLDPTTEYQVDVQVKKGGIAQDLSKYTLSNRSSNTSVSSSEDAFDFTPIDNYTKAVVLTVTNGMSFDELPKWVEFTAVNNRNTDKKASDKLYIKSAQRGEDLSSLVVAPKTIFVNVGVSGGNTGKIIDPTKEHTIEFQIKKGDKPQQLSNYSIVVKHQTSSTLDKSVLVYDKDEYTKYFTIECKNGESVPPTHTITAKKGSLTLNEDVTIHPVQQGLVGSSGKLYYSMGYWDETTAAEKFYKNDDKRICYIYHVDSFYERTDNPLMTYTDEDGKTRYYPPDEEVELFGSNGGWAVMPKYSAIIADFIMAKFARFGSPNGGVFYSNLLFSAMGVDENGNQVPYDMYSDDMFVGDDENGYEFSGVFTPNVFIDFLKGVLESRNAKIYGSIATPPKSLPSPNEEGKIVLDFETGFNFSGDPVDESRSIVLPTNAIYDGVQASIVNYGTGKGYYSVATDLGEDDDFLFDGRGPVGKIIREVHLYGVSEMKLRAIKVKVAGIGWRCKWFLENSQNFGFESRWGNLGVFSNQIPSSPIETVAIYTVVNETIRDSLSLIPSYMSRYGFVKNEDTLYYYLTIDDIQLDSTRTLIKVNHETSYTAHASISNNVITIYFKEEDNTRSNFGEWSIEILRLI